MKRTTLINRDLSAAVAALGHGDLLVVADAGHAIPREVERIDLAVRPGLPSATAVLETILSELDVEGFVVSEDIVARNPAQLAAYEALLAGVPCRQVPHTEFRELVRRAKTVVRTGEMTAYANLILEVSGSA